MELVQSDTGKRSTATRENIKSSTLDVKSTYAA
jgi:hypothetical protein